MDPSQSMHAYEKLPLFTAGIALGIWLIAVHVLMLAKATEAKRFLRRLSTEILSTSWWIRSPRSS